jgi:hypothetical protein
VERSRDAHLEAALEVVRVVLADAGVADRDPVG